MQVLYVLWKNVIIVAVCVYRVDSDRWGEKTSCKQAGYKSWCACNTLPNMMWKVFVYGIDLATSHFIDSQPMLLDTTMALRSLIGSLDCGYICEGNRDGKFEQLICHRRFSGSSSKCHLYHVCMGMHIFLCVWGCTGLHVYYSCHAHLYINVYT